MTENEYFSAAAKVARARWASDDLKISDDLGPHNFSRGEDGTWVRAYIWISNSDLPSPDEEGIDE